MINYEILRVDEGALMFQVRYSKEGKPEYYANVGLPSGFTESTILEYIDMHSQEAELYWARSENSIEITSTVGEVKERIFEPAPEYNPTTHKIEEILTETETTIIHGWSVWEKSEGEIAVEVREKRDHLLSITDVWAYSDRTMSEAMTEYRQALRDIPSQEGFPTSVIWPVQPID